MKTIGAETQTLDRPAHTPGCGALMQAAVYRGAGNVELCSVPVPEIGKGELLVRVDSCGVCATDIKKIEHGLLPPPRIFGHEIAGTVVSVGAGVTRLVPGDRVAVYHHVPCRSCFYCRRKLFSQCEAYRRTGTTAGFVPAGGGFAEYVRVMDWIVETGTVRIPDHVSFEEASFLEPLNTCLKALGTAELAAGEVVVIYGQGPIGLLLTQAARCQQALVVGLDLMDRRLQTARELGAVLALNPKRDPVETALAELTDGRGADLAILATADPGAVLDAQKIVRRGGRVLLFAQTVPGEIIRVDASRICMEEKRLIGSYSASIEFQSRSADLIFRREVQVARLVTHRFPLANLMEAIRLASHPSDDSMKVVVKPCENS
ncbi:MAG: alcohol dehydrogenase catalytic domain-containing protein [Acidobacteria bacterium]|nr:alcohol dehydrogenase catalytic domain-containing protein [Acidobacteriota bacterium]